MVAEVLPAPGSVVPSASVPPASGVMSTRPVVFGTSADVAASCSSILSTWNGIGAAFVRTSSYVRCTFPSVISTGAGVVRNIAVSWVNFVEGSYPPLKPPDPATAPVAAALPVVGPGPPPVSVHAAQAMTTPTARPVTSARSARLSPMVVQARRRYVDGLETQVQSRRGPRPRARASRRRPPPGGPRPPDPRCPAHTARVPTAGRGAG